MNNPEDGGRQSEGPVIAIYRHPHRPNIYRVEVEGKEIERLRSFDLHIHNDPTGAGDPITPWSNLCRHPRGPSERRRSWDAASVRTDNETAWTEPKKSA